MDDFGSVLWSLSKGKIQTKLSVKNVLQIEALELNNIWHANNKIFFTTSNSYMYLN